MRNYLLFKKLAIHYRTPCIFTLETSMKCPSCPDTTLVMTERQSVEIDYCPACRGIWLDRGELDKLLERAGNAASHSAVASTPSTPSHQPRMQPDFEDSSYREGQRYYRSRKKSWLHEIFD